MRLTPPYTAITIDFDDENITTTSNYAIIKVKDDYPPELLTFYLNSEYTKEQIYKFSEQTTIKVINITNIKNFDIKKIDDENKTEKLYDESGFYDTVEYNISSNQLINKNKSEHEKQVTYTEDDACNSVFNEKPVPNHLKSDIRGHLDRTYDERILLNSMEFDLSQPVEDKKELYIKLVRTFEQKKKLIEKQLKLEEDLIEEIIFGDQ